MDKLDSKYALTTYTVLFKLCPPILGFSKLKYKKIGEQRVRSVPICTGLTLE